jgi:hypothetical protein
MTVDYKQRVAVRDPDWQAGESEGGDESPPNRLLLG